MNGECDREKGNGKWRKVEPYFMLTIPHSPIPHSTVYSRAAATDRHHGVAVATKGIQAFTANKSFEIRSSGFLAA